MALACAVALLLVSASWIAARVSHPTIGAEARQLAAAPFVRDPGREVVVVTGSSTVRLWRGSAAAFPDAQVVNTGFGGSTMADLVLYYQGLVGRFAPAQVFIGSGDNDLAQGRSPQQVLADTRTLLGLIHRDYPQTQVALVAAKPSLKRWGLRSRYEQLNAGFAQLAAGDGKVVYVDVWNRLLDADGRVRPELYRSDGLHLNGLGYRIYAATLTAAHPPDRVVAAGPPGTLSTH